MSNLRLVSQYDDTIISSAVSTYTYPAGTGTPTPYELSAGSHILGLFNNLQAPLLIGGVLVMPCPPTHKVTEYQDGFLCGDAVHRVSGTLSLEIQLISSSVPDVLCHEYDLIGGGVTDTHITPTTLYGSDNLYSFTLVVVPDTRYKLSYNGHELNIRVLSSPSTNVFKFINRYGVPELFTAIMDRSHTTDVGYDAMVTSRLSHVSGIQYNASDSSVTTFTTYPLQGSEASRLRELVGSPYVEYDGGQVFMKGGGLSVSSKDDSYTFDVKGIV